MTKSFKERAKKKAQSEGMPFASILKLATQAYVDGKLDVELVAQPKLNEKTRRELIKISKDLKAGKNLSPLFDNAEDAIAYLKSRTK